MTVKEILSDLIRKARFEGWEKGKRQHDTPTKYTLGDETYPKALYSEAERQLNELIREANQLLKEASDVLSDYRYGTTEAIDENDFAEDYNNDDVIEVQDKIDEYLTHLKETEVKDE